MPHRSLLLVLVISLLALSGCAATGEPETAFTPAGNLAYDFKVVWDATSETLSQEGYAIAERTDHGDESGVMRSRVVTVKTDKLTGKEEGLRVSARITKQAPKKFRLELAASRFERAGGSATVEPGPWRYVGRDEELLARLRARIDENIERRYRPREGR